MPRFFYVIFIVCFARILTAHELTVDSCELIFEEKSYPGEAIENVESISMQPPNFTAYSSTGFRVIYHRNNYRTYLISQDSGVQFSEFKQVYRALNRIGLAKHIAGYVEKDNLLDFTKDPVFHFVARKFRLQFFTITIRVEFSQRKQMLKNWRRSIHSYKTYC